jgi:hypothetical protein
MKTLLNTISFSPRLQLDTLQLRPGFAAGRAAVACPAETGQIFPGYALWFGLSPLDLFGQGHTTAWTKSGIATSTAEERDCVKTQIIASFLFVLVRVISWIVCYAPEKSDPRNHTKEHERSPGAISSFDTAPGFIQTLTIAHLGF